MLIALSESGTNGEARAIQTDSAPKALGHTPGIRHSGMLFVSGQLGLDPPPIIWSVTISNRR